MTTPDKYNNAIPQPSDTIADSQENFLVNFSQLYNVFNQDHIALNDPTNPGNHKIARLFLQTSALNTLVSDVALYSKGRNLQTTQLFYREQGNQLEYQYSNYQLYNIPDVLSRTNLVQTSAFSFLPGNIIVYFGMVNPNSTTFRLVLNPEICNNIAAINFCAINKDVVYPPVVALNRNTQGLFNSVDLTQTGTIIQNIPDLYYIIFGNPVI